MPDLSPQTQKLISRYQGWYHSQKSKEGIATIHVDEVASKVAAFYEKIREIVDWKEEHLMRRAAIERMLKRRLLLQEQQGMVAQPLVLELIRAGHFPNDQIPEKKIDDVQNIINKYIFLLQNSSQTTNSKTRIQLYSWLLSIAACEIEEALSPALRERALIEYMKEIMEKRIRIKEGTFVIGGMKEKDKEAQIYIACQRALFKLEPSLITYHLLKQRFPNWSNLDLPSLQQISQQIFLIWQEIEKELTHPLKDKFYQVCEKQDTAFLILGDILSKDPLNIEKQLKEPGRLEELTKEAYTKRLGTLKAKLRRAAVYSTSSVFLSKILSLLALEVLFAKYFIGNGLQPLTIIIDILGPTLLMTFLVGTIRPPAKENLFKVALEVSKIAYQTEQKEFYELKLPIKRGVGLYSIIILFYLLSFCFSLGLILWGLHFLHFPLFSSIIFIIFISLIAFSGVKIRERARELDISDKKEGLLHIIIDLFSIPIVQCGKWLLERWQKFNLIAIFFNLLLDVPFAIFIEFLEQWRYFLKEKKEEIH